MVIKFPLATMLDFLQEQLTVILRYSPRQKSFYPNDGILGEHFFSYFRWQIMEAELLWSLTYKLYIFINICELFEQKALRDWTDSSKHLHASNVTRTVYYLLRQSEDVKFMGHFMKKEVVSHAWGDFQSPWKFLTILNLASSSWTLV